MTNNRVRELAHAIRYAGATTPPHDLNGWIADALDLLSAGARVAASREEETAVDWEQAARFLFDRLDDVDTAGDATYSAEEYRELVESIHRRRFEVAQTDGYTVTFNPVARPEPLREETGELEGRLTGFENLAATAVLQRDRAIERAERAEAERDRLRTALDSLPDMVREQARTVLIIENIDRPVSATPWLMGRRYGDGEYDARWYTVRALESRVVDRIFRALREARQSTPSEEE